MPRLRAFLPDEYGGDTDVFDVAQDGRGVLFFALASDGGVLSYDGARWTPTATDGAPRVLETDADGRVWVGGGDLGYLEVGTGGAVRYRSLAAHVPTAVEVFDVGDIATGPYGVAFVDNRHLLIWDGASFAHWQAAEGQSFGAGVTLQETLFVALNNGGALRLEGDQLVAVPWLEEYRIRTLLPYEDNGLLIVASRTGPGCVLWLDGDGVKRSFSAALDRLDADRGISTAVVLQGGGLAVTTQDALFVLDRQGGVVSRIGPAQGLDPLSVTALHQDRQGSLWISQQDGIRRLALSLPITGYGASEGLSSSASSTVRFDGKLYAAATDSGLRVLLPGEGAVPARFEPVPGVDARTYDLAVVGDTLLAGTSEGVLALDASGRVETIAEGYLVTVAESVAPDRAFAGFERQVLVLTGGDEGWRVLQDVRDIPIFAYMMSEGREGELWLWGFDGELVRLTFEGGYARPPIIERMHEEQSWAGFEHIDGELLFFRTGGGVDRQGADGRLEPDPRFADIDWHDRPEGIANFMHMIEDAEGGVWLIGDRGFTRLLREGDTYRASSTHRLATDVDLNLTGYRDAEAETVLWLGHDRGLLRYDFGAHVDLPSAAPVIHRVNNTSAGAEDDSQIVEVDGVPTQPFGRGPVVFTYGLPHFVHERAVDYQVRLAGFDDNWAEWTVETRKEFTNLPEGEYRFEVRARYFGRPVESVASYAFGVLPPWYRTWWAYLLWGLSVISAVSLVVGWRSRRLAAETRRLGALIEARTAELASEKQQVEAQASTLEERAGELRSVNQRLQREMQATREANDARQRLEARVQEAQRLESLGVLAGGIAHDFNNLLVGVVGNAELAQLRTHDPEVDRHLESIVEASGMAADLCRQMLAYAGKAPFDRAKVALDEMAGEMIELLRSSLGRQTALRVETKNPGVWVEGDSSQLRQILLNLAINAGEAIGDGGHVIVRCGDIELDEATIQRTRGGETLAPGRYAYLEVEDNGEGMDEETAARVFEPFYSTKFLGRGLGLAVVFGIVRRHRGAVTIDSRLARGTRVRIYLPSTDPPPPDASVQEAAAPVPEPVRGRGSVLIVDDEAFVRQVAESAVSDAGFEAIVTAGGEEALRVFEQRRSAIRCVLLDLSMPEMDGRATFRALRHEAPELPVILMSGYGEHEASNQFPEQKPSAFLTKPFSLDSLQEAVRRVALSH